MKKLVNGIEVEMSAVEVAEFEASRSSTNAEIKLDDYRRAIQRHLDTKAQERGYDDIKSAALRAGYPGPFHDEGVKYAQWMDACWAAGYQILTDVQQGKIAQPSLQALVEQLPALVI